jgi:hypothetical protein
MAKTWCSVCGERQFHVPDNELPTCANGHGGAPGLDQSEAQALGYDTSKRLRRIIRVPRAEVHKRPTIAKRSQDERDLSDATCTPKWLADFLYKARGNRPFDLDPCSNERSHIIAHWSFSLEKKLDGLKLPWRGEVFKNNPFSAPMLWQEKAVYELTLGRCTELVELCKMDPSTEWWGVIAQPIVAGGADWSHREIVYTPDLWLFRDRIQYDEHPLLIEKRRCEIAEGKRKGNKSGKSSNNFCSALIHHRFDKPRLPLEEFADLWIRP